MTASEMFGVPVEGMPAEVRRRAKAINFGIIYGISAFGLANQLGIPKEEAGAYIKTYFERFPGIRDYMDEHQASARTSTATSRPSSAGASTIRRSTPSNPACAASWSAPPSTRRSRARPPTSSAAPWSACRARWSRAGLKSARMLLQVHDELVFEVRRGRGGQDALRTVKEVMEGAALPAVALTVPIHVDAKAADNWEAAH